MSDLTLWLTRLVLVLALLLPWSAFAQPYVARHFGIDDGLVQSQVMAVHQDPAGFMWFGTLGGLSRFDGLTFTNFTVEDGLASNVINTLFSDTAGRLWIGTDEGISIFDGVRFTTINEAQGLPDGYIYDIQDDPSGAVWVATRRGLAVVDEARVRPVDLVDAGPSPGVYALTLDANGRIWVGTSLGLCPYDQVPDGCIDAGDGLPHSVVISTLIDRRGRLVAGTPRGLGIVDGDSVRAYDSSHLASPIVNAVLEDTEGGIWAGTRAGISRLDASGELSLVRRDKALIVTSLFQDREGNVWVGASGMGVYQYRKTAFFHKNDDYGIEKDVVLSTFEDSRGRMWVGTLTLGAFVIDGDQVTRYTTAEGLRDDHVRSITEDHAGAIWLGTAFGLSQIVDDVVAPFDAFGGPGSSYTYSLHQQRAGPLWIGTRDGLFTMSGGTMRPAPMPEAVSSASILTLMEQRDGTMWIGTTEGLLRHRDGIIDRIEQFSDRDITAIAETTDGTVWIGTVGYGLLLYHPGSNTVQDTISTRNGLGSGTVYSAVFDRMGDLWIGTSLGISRLDGRQYRTAGIKSIRSYSIEDGIVGGETNMNSATIDRKGRYWIGTVEGLMVYDRAIDPRNTVPPPVYIADLRLFLESIQRDTSRDVMGRSLPADLVFEYNQNHIAIDYFGLSFTHPEQVRYQYKLDGFDTAWSPETSDRFATYSHIPPGDYVFRVRARNRDGVWSTAPASYAFRIEAPFWQEPWFYALCVVAGVFGIIGIVHFRTHTLNQRRKRLEEMVEARAAELKRTHSELLAARENALAAAQAKTNFMAAITHELRTPMNGIMGMNELMSMTHLDDEQVEYAATITECSRNLMEIIENLLTFSDLAGSQRAVTNERFQVSDLLIDAIDAIREDAERKQLHLQCHVAPDVPAAFEADRRHLEQILHQLLTNAVKFTERGMVRIDVRRIRPPDGSRSETWLQLAVQDTGIGMDAAQLRQAFEAFSQVDMSATRRFGGTGIGLALARQLTALLGGDLQASSRPGEGSTFYVTVPVNVEAEIRVA